MVTRDTNWHLDKRVSIFTLAMLMAQFLGLVIGGVWFVGEVKNQITNNSVRVTSVEREVEEINDEIDRVNAAISSQAVQLGRIEENVSAIRAYLEIVVRNVDRNTDRGYGFPSIERDRN